MAFRNGWIFVMWMIILVPLLTEALPEDQGLSLKDDEIIKFESKELARVGINNPNFWTENNERSTSANYTLWKEADVHLVDWPGNITIRDPKWPLLKWTHKRAKFRVNHCCEFWSGIEMRAYAYRYLYLTWGPYRFAQTFSPPLTIPATLFKQVREKRTTEIVISDFGFVQDGLIIAAPKKGVVILVYGLEMAYARFQQEPLQPLKYSLSKGISSPVDKIVTQFCCSKTDANICPHGETVVAYKEHSYDVKIFISTDGGESFKMLQPKPLEKRTMLHSVLAYPDIGKIILIHGTSKMVFIEHFSIQTGAPIGTSKSRKPQKINGIRGYLQAERIGEEMSLLIWDDCNVWYSLAEGKNLTQGIFYIHGYLYGDNSIPWKNYIVPKYCKFGRNSSLAVSKSGKLALLDSYNQFHLGVDTKTEIFQLVALKVDVSLILAKHQRSIVPHFDHSQHPKLLYPPRFLELPDKAMLGRNYSQRLAVRLLPKTVFPSEFITVFYDENASLPKKFKKFALPPCQTSSISVNRSVSQKSKIYSVGPKDQLNFTVRFKSRKNSTKQLHYEPSDVNKFLWIRMRPLSIEETEPEDAQFWLNYEVVIKPRGFVDTRRIFMINFFTFKTLRCNIQPSNQVFVKIDNNPQLKEMLSREDADMEIGSYLKVEPTQTEYGRTYGGNGCSSCSACSKADEKAGKCSGQVKSAVDEAELYKKFGYHTTVKTVYSKSSHHAEL